MDALAVEITIMVVCVSALSALIAILVDRKYYQQRKYDEWSAKNDHVIADLERKIAEHQIKRDEILGKLLALGIKLPGSTK